MRLLIATLISLSGLTCALGQTASPPLISVTGTAEIKVAPDEVVLRTTIITRNANLQEVKKANDVIASRAIAFLKEKGIKAEDIQTDYITLRPEYKNNDWEVKPEYYTASKSIEVIIRKVETLEPMLTGLLAAGVNSVDGITFRNSKYRELRIKARAMAVKFAKEKAHGLAAELEVKCGKVHSIEAIDDGGSQHYWYGRGYGNFNQSQVMSNVGGGGGEGDGATSEGFSVGQISITSRVQASFLIE
jgi:uncharacterized protein